MDWRKQLEEYAELGVQEGSGEGENSEILGSEPESPGDSVAGISKSRALLQNPYDTKNVMLECGEATEESGLQFEDLRETSRCERCEGSSLMPNHYGGNPRALPSNSDSLFVEQSVDTESQVIHSTSGSSSCGSGKSVTAVEDNAFNKISGQHPVCEAEVKSMIAGFMRARQKLSNMLDYMQEEHIWESIYCEGHGVNDQCDCHHEHCDGPALAGFLAAFIKARKSPRKSRCLIVHEMVKRVAPIFDDCTSRSFSF